MSDSKPVLETVELREGEWIVPRGAEEVTWFVRQNDAWVHVSTWPDVSVERLDAGAGTVWESRVSLTIARGTKLMRVETRPKPYERTDPLEHLERGPSAPPRHVDRRYYVVGRGGTLDRDPTS